METIIMYRAISQVYRIIFYLKIDQFVILWKIGLYNFMM